MPRQLAEPDAIAAELRTMRGHTVRVDLIGDAVCGTVRGAVVPSGQDGIAIIDRAVNVNLIVPFASVSALVFPDDPCRAVMLEVGL